MKNITEQGVKLVVLDELCVDERMVAARTFVLPTDPFRDTLLTKPVATHCHRSLVHVTHADGTLDVIY